MQERNSKEKDLNTLKKRRERLLIIDSSFLMLPVSGKSKRLNVEDALFRLSEGRKLVVLDVTIRELNLLKSKSKGKKKLAADFALDLIKVLKMPVIKVPEEIKEEVIKEAEGKRGWEITDEILARTAKKLKAAVATTDLELKRKLEKMGVPVYYLRGKKWIYSSGEYV